MKGTTTGSKKKNKSAAKKKSNKIPSGKLKRPKKNKEKGVVKKKAKTSAKTKAKSVAGKKTGKSNKVKTKSPVKAPLVEEKITHGEDLHLIPVEGEIHPIGTDEAHRLENIFQNREEVTLQQENQKVKDALSSPKNLKKNFRIPGHR